MAEIQEKYLRLALKSFRLLALVMSSMAHLSLLRYGEWIFKKQYKQPRLLPAFLVAPSMAKVEFLPKQS
jgi:aminopeptidase-like protein